MANYDKPAFLPVTLSKTLDENAMVNDLEVPPVTDPSFQLMWGNAVTAFTVSGGDSSGPTSYPIGG